MVVAQFQVGFQHLRGSTEDINNKNSRPDGTSAEQKVSNKHQACHQVDRHVSSRYDHS